MGLDARRLCARVKRRGHHAAIAVRVRWAVINTVAAAAVVPAFVRYRLLRCCGIVVPATGGLRAGFAIDGGDDLTIGDGTWINTACYFDCTAPIAIGANCNIAMGVMFCTSTHVPGDEARRAGPSTSAPIVVGDGCWIGARATLLPGVAIAPGCVVAAGAVVTRDTEPHRLYGGVPARPLGDLPTAEDAPAAGPARRLQHSSQFT
jgi:maltose O-acetyltransferase